ncbi:molybdopterin molybdotransferase MoeA [Peteryoungia desertarenae]|uniref:Molybdopterin molybdenumtransferase n=1 Tax=Peteryoungia desertarenae TaxID=1813451 RepID=A0ABX6QPC0_9HYPH|nr:gephyrin-like molybdotransferase Glp [Peteryoungia desertarenae]QLF70383.1 molybdopterin molybdotransferase MoeA [Peteryoungia desertarenae]
MSLLPVEEAQQRLLDRASPIQDIEAVGLHQAAQRVLAKDVVSKLTQPPFHASAMDGYALRAADAAEPGTELEVIGESAAGHAFDGMVRTGTAVRIFTGAPVPDGADSVLLQEDAEKLSPRCIRTLYPVSTGRHIRPRGQDFTEGQTVLNVGAKLDFARLTLAAAANHDQLPVYRQPRVALIATGDELVPPGGKPGPSQIIGSNTFGVAALAKDNGADVLDLGIVPDDRDAIHRAIEAAQAKNVDVIVTLGGASVGDHDLVQSTFLAAGMVLDFWKIAMRPGKPLMVGNLGTTHVLGLPGNPVSSMVCGLLFLEPLLARLGHLPAPNRMSTAVLASPLKENDRRQDYLRARLSIGPSGERRVTSFEKQDSSMMNIFAQSDCLIIRPPHAPAMAAGETCPIMLLRDIGH